MTVMVFTKSNTAGYIVHNVRSVTQMRKCTVITYDDALETRTQVLYNEMVEHINVYDPSLIYAE